MSYALCAIGNALVDIIVSTDDSFLAANQVAKGGMTLVDDARVTALHKNSGGEAQMSSGGSAANTLAGFASLGGACAFMGKVGADEFGAAFTQDLKTQKVYFATPPSEDAATGRCLVFVTPDAQRSMSTFLGAAVEFGPNDIDAALIQQSAITYLEGYLFDRPLAQNAFRKAATIAHDASRKLSLTLSDTFCVARHRAAFLDLVSGAVDILFANEEEINALCETRDLAQAMQIIRERTDIAVITRSAKGAVIVAGAQTYEVPAQPISHVVDTTGAGDLYAAGFLYGLSHGKNLPEAARIGAVAAAEVISHYGPRPQKKLADLL